MSDPNRADERAPMEPPQPTAEQRRIALEQKVAHGVAELQANRDLLKAIIDSSPDMIQVFGAVRGPDGAIVDFVWVLNNHTSESRYGEVRGESLLTRNPGVIVEGIFDAFKRVTETGVPEQAERHYVHEQFDGWFLQSVVKLGDGVATTTKEITGWKRSQAELLRLQEEMAQAKLRESEQRFRALVMAGKVSIYRMSPDWRVMYQLDSKELAITASATENWADVYILPEDRALVDQAIAKAIQSRSLFELEHRVRLADGGVGWVRSTAVPLTNAAGEVVEWFGAGTDISPRKKAEEALRESQRLQSAVLERLPVGVALLDRDGGVILANPEWARFVPGPIPSRDPERSWRWRTWDGEGILVQPEDFPGVRALRGETIDSVEFLYETDSGAEVWTSVAAIPLTNEQGEVSGAIAIIHDIDAAKRASEGLRESDERFRQFGAASSDVLWIRHAETMQWEYLSPAFESLYGESRATALSGNNLRRWTELIHPEDRELALRQMNRIRAGERLTFEYRIVRPSDGELRWVRDSDFPLLDRQGRVQRIGGVGRDITEEKTAADRMQIMVAELQHRTRNLIGVVRSIAEHTMAATGPTASFLSHFFERLDALSRVQGLLSRADEEPITLEALIRSELDALGATRSVGERIRLSGPSVRIRNTIVQTLSLAIHELATNARKYGALAEGTGSLTVEWEVRDDTVKGRWLTLEWKEECRARETPIDAARMGFGRELIERALPYSLSARTSYALHERGVRCVIELPLDRRRAG